MRQAAIAALLAVSLVPGAPAALAHADEPPVTGPLCGFSSVSHPAEDGIQVGEIDGGPLAVTDPAVMSVTLVCTIQVSPNYTHAGADAATASATGSALVVLPPTPVTYRVAEGDDVGLCSEVVVTDASGTTRHYYQDPWSGGFSSDPDTDCSYPICVQSHCEPPGVDPDALLDAVVEPVLCPILTIFSRPAQ